MNHIRAEQSLDWYIDEAKERAGIVSDGKLSLGLGMSRQGVQFWRAKKAWPSDANMIALAKLAGIDPAHALCDLGRWRAKDHTTAEMWKRIRDMLPAFLVVMMFIGGTAFNPRSAAASVSAFDPRPIHYATIACLAWWLARRAR